MCRIRQHTKSLQSLEQSTLLDTWHLFFIMNLKVTSCRSACHPVLGCICMNFITIILSRNSNCLTPFINLMLHISKQEQLKEKKNIYICLIVYSNYVYPGLNYYIIHLTCLIAIDLPYKHDLIPQIHTTNLHTICTIFKCFFFFLTRYIHYTKVGQITCSSSCKMWVISHEPLRPYSLTCLLTGPVICEFQSLICGTLLMRLSNPPRPSFEQLRQHVIFRGRVSVLGIFPVSCQIEITQCLLLNSGTIMT